MIKIKLMVNGELLKKLEYSSPVTIKQITEEQNLAELNILACKVSFHYKHQNYLIESDCNLNCLTVAGLAGLSIYQDTLIFIMMKAFSNLYNYNPDLVVEHSIGDAVYCEFFKETETKEEVAVKLTEEMRRICEADLPIERLEIPIQEAINIFGKQKREDVIYNLKTYKNPKIGIYKCGEYYDYYIRQLAESTGYASVFEVKPYNGGILLRFPLRKSGKLSPEFKISKKLFDTNQEYDKWLNIMKLHNVSTLNQYGETKEIQEIILMEESLQEKKIAGLADKILNNKECKLILIAGPSSSGKTTFAKRLSIQLRINNFDTIILGMDDFFLPRTETPRKANGEFDFESIKSMDLEYLNSALTEILSGKRVQLPKYDFKSGTQQLSNEFVEMKNNSVVIMEGIHGINDALTPAIPAENKIKIYVSPLNQLNIDYHNRIPTTDCRKIRRIVRDFQYRGYSAEETLERWESIREGEEQNIFPFQENADFMFNSCLTYELGVLKKYAVPILQKVPTFSSSYVESRRLISLLEHFSDIPDNCVPFNSILREFTSDSAFDY
ncbi:MAG: nucleoside kinase [Candidatus Cloacimonadota bacterium]|nr:MAG: nucleoside kinase [Candidatus Cloacimonadota bacterium]